MASASSTASWHSRPVTNHVPRPMRGTSTPWIHSVVVRSGTARQTSPGVFRAAVLTLVCLAVTGCGGSGRRAPVRGAVDLSRAPGGAPAGGRAAGHRGGALEAATEGPSVAFRVRVSPPGARLVVGGARATTKAVAHGALVVWLHGLRPGAT